MATPDNSSPGGYLTLPVRVSGPGEEWNSVECNVAGRILRLQNCLRYRPYSGTPASLSTSSKQSTVGAVGAQVRKVTSATTCRAVDRIV